MDDAARLRAEKYQPIAALLAEAYGYPEWRPSLPAVDELVNTILSQNTNDNNRDRAFERLTARFPSWEAVRDAPEAEVIEAVRPAGLANQKGPRIQRALRYLTETQGSITLELLKEMNIQEAKAFLTGIEGIGPKTAAIVLLFALGKPAFPVDTHVHRVSGRLGLIRPKISADQAHTVLEEIVPEEDYYPFHLQMIWHGRKVCHARMPACDVCPLQAHCDYYQAALNPDQQPDR